MSTKLSRLTSLPDDLMLLANVARTEGYFMLDRLIERFKSGSNRFDSPGEALFGVARSSALIGIGGLNIDPYFKSSSIGRVRHLYIHPDARGTGVGRMITQAIESQARGHFSRLQLFTPERAAGEFYVALGFEVVEGVHKVSHGKRLGPQHDDATDRSTADR